MKSSVLLALAGVGLLVPSVASAQDQVWLKDRRYTEGPGYLVGDFELHPGAAISFGYDSNYARLTNSTQAALRLMVTPSFYFSTLGAQRKESGGGSPPSVTFRGGISATYNEFIPLQSGSNVAAERNIGGNADLALTILPGRPWSGNLTAAYARVLAASAEGATSGFNSQGTLNRDVPSAGAEIAWAPGSGLLEWRLGYQFQGTFFEDSSFSTLNTIMNQIETRGRWRFLPRTSLVFDAKFGFYSFGNAGGVYQKFDSHPVRALIGVNGLVTSSFAVLAMIGYGGSFYQVPTFTGLTIPAENFDSVIGQAEVKWFITPNTTNDAAAPSLFLSSLAVGFTRDFVDSYIGSTYFEQDRGYVALSYMYGGKFLLVVTGGAGPILYPQLTPTEKASPTMAATTIPGFTDIRVDASVFAEYRFKDQFGINATFRYNQNFDPANVMLPGSTSNQLAFQEIEAYLGARWLM
jgi:hypothetical protein